MKPAPPTNANVVNSAAHEPNDQLCRRWIDAISSPRTWSPGLRAEVAFTVNTHADGVGFHVAISDHQHGVDFHLLGVGDFGFDVVVAGVELGADALRAEFLLDGARAIDKRGFVTDRQDADLLWT